MCDECKAIVDLVNERPNEQFVISLNELQEVDLSASQLAKMTNRDYEPLTEYIPAKMPNTLLRSAVCVFLPRIES